MSEQTIWKGTPSQIVNLNKFIICLLLAPFTMGLSLIYALWSWFVIKNIKYELTTERIITRQGVLNKRTDELELYRLKDYALIQPIFLRIFSLGNVILSASDVSHGNLKIVAVKDGDSLRDMIRCNAEKCRKMKSTNVGII